MAYLWIESFDQFSGGATDPERTVNQTQLSNKYNVAATSDYRFNVIAGPMPGGTPLTAGSLSQPGQIRIALPSVLSECYLSCWIYYSTLPSSTSTKCFEFRRSTSVQCEVGITSDGKVRVRRGTTTLEETSAGTISSGTWYRIEARILAGNGTAGSWTVKLDGTQILDGTGDTQATFSTNFDELGLYFMNQSEGSSGGITSMSNVAVQDSAGDFLDEWYCSGLFPSADGTTNDWTPNTGSNYQTVDEVPYDNDTTYNEGDTNEDVDLYAFDNVSLGSDTIEALSINSVARLTVTGEQVANVIRSGGTNYYDTAQALTTTYKTKHDIHATDPDTGTAWTESGLNAAEFGVQATIP